MEKELEDEKTELKIDVEELISSKSPKLKRFLPRFIINYLKNIIHQDEINVFLAKHKDLFGIDFADEVVRFFHTKINIVNPENIPLEGRYIVVSNHPLGGLDGIILISTFGKKRRDIFFPVNDLLLYLRNLNNIFIPINKHGRNSTDGVRQINKAFETDGLILYFPAGLCSRKQKGEICDLEWKKTVISKAKQFKRDIIPVHFEGRNRNFFYNLAKIRKWLGIKANIEMLYLSDEMFHQQHKTFTITIGKPINHETFTKEKSDVDWAKWLKEHVYSLADVKNKKN